MKNLVLTCAARFEALADRERISVFVAVVLVCVYVIFSLGIEPAQRRAQTLGNQIAQQTTELETLRTRLLQQNKQADPDAANRTRGEELKSNVDALGETLKAMQRDLVSADRMGALLQEMLERESGLELVAMRTLPVAPLIAKGEQEQTRSSGSASDPGKAPSVYKHGVEITVRGSYAHLHGYLARLEKSPWRMFWWRAKLTTNDDAPLTMVVTIYTLSLEKAWLQV
jgi:MSHA biogenesis protein MshJ